MEQAFCACSLQDNMWCRGCQSAIYAENWVPEDDFFLTKVSPAKKMLQCLDRIQRMCIARELQPCINGQESCSPCVSLAVQTGIDTCYSMCCSCRYLSGWERTSLTLSPLQVAAMLGMSMGEALWPHSPFALQVALPQYWLGKPVRICCFPLSVHRGVFKRGHQGTPIPSSAGGFCPLI